MKKYFPKLIKQPKPQRLMNVTSDRCLTLCLHQGLKLIIATDSTASVNSDYLYIEKFEKGDDKHVLYISQKYDLSKWAEVGKVFLGTIDVQGQINHGIVSLYQEGTSDTNTVTVINPGNQEVKLEPNEKLEIVCYDNSINKYQKEDWCVKIDDIETSCQNIVIRPEKQHTILTELVANEIIN